MSRPEKRVAIGVDAYKIVGLPTSEGLELYNELIVRFGPAVTKMMEKHATDTDEQKKAPEYIEGLMLETLLRSVSGLPPDIMNRLSKKFAPTCKVLAVIGQSETWPPLANDEIYEDHFSCRPKQWTLWLAECLKLNFADFFPQTGTADATSSNAIPAGKSR